MRLDRALAARGLARSRTEAQALIAAGQVQVNGQPAERPSQDVEPETALTIVGEMARFVSRGGLKLEAALEKFGIDVRNRQALDVGASTGGFTDCLLQRGARHVIALDVGHGQMAPGLADDPRVERREGINARFLAPHDFPHPFDVIVVDLSFISLTLILPALSPLLLPEGDLICLVKPQFEAGAEKLGRGGVVRDAQVWNDVLERVTGAAKRLGMDKRGLMESPIEGAHGNREFLLWLGRAGTVAVDRE